MEQMKDDQRNSLLEDLQSWMDSGKSIAEYARVNGLSKRRLYDLRHRNKAKGTEKKHTTSERETIMMGLESWLESGKSISSFAKKHKISRKSIYNWRYRRMQDGVNQAEEQHLVHLSGPIPRFQEQSSIGVEINYGNLTITIPPGFRAEDLTIIRNGLGGGGNA